MGRKERREREQKRESRALKHSAEKRKHMMIAVAVFASVVAIVGWSAYNFATMDTTQISGAPFGAGPLNSDHTHTGILVKIFGDTFPFHEVGYQVQSEWIHFENHDGTTIHRHATGVTLGFLFESLGIELTDECYVFPNGQRFCTNEDYTLRFFIDGVEMDDIRNHIPMEDGRILIAYGDESEEEITAMLAELNSMELVR
ncbi:MAG: protein-disulfide isomerase [Nitrosopumilaceae archaeon]|nr:protein-disulfide isomerase [Nitrosopumilaceae archaeon]